MTYDFKNTGAGFRITTDGNAVEYPIGEFGVMTHNPTGVDIKVAGKVHTVKLTDTITINAVAFSGTSLQLMDNLSTNVFNV